MADQETVTDAARKVIPTEKAREQFDTRVDSYQKQLKSSWAIVKDAIQSGEQITSDSKRLKQIQTDICKLYGKFEVVRDEYSAFLKRHRTDVAEKLFDELREFADRNETLMNNVVSSIGDKILLIDMEKRSKSSATTVKGEAMRLKEEFARKEAELKSHDAALREEEQVILAKFQRKRAEIAAQLEKERKCLEQLPIKEEIKSNLEFDLNNIKTEDSDERTKTYIANLMPEKSEVIDLNVGEAIGKFLIKKDLSIQRLRKFTDDPIDYLAWVNTFKAVISDNNVSPSEECDLLINWLGPESCKQALNIKASCCNNPNEAVRRIWERLSTRYGAPELVVNAMQKKLTAVPRIKENRKLYDMADILSECESLKSVQQYRQVLAYLDSPIGINPIVTKLPTHLQNKWAERARSYKLKHGVPYPPFEVFVAFVKEKCDLLNDPSFQFYPEVKDNRRISHSTFISNKKTEVNVSNDNEQTKCPLHPDSGSHSLDQCRNFKKLSFVEKRQCLKDNNLCFRCCRSKHVIKNCNVEIKCKTCGSSKHVTIMHRSADSQSTQRQLHGVMEQETRQSQVVCKCANIETNEPVSKSCAKIVKVKLFHKDSPNKKIDMYCIIDEQSNKSLACSEIFDTFDKVSFGELSYTLSSCHGRKTVMGRIASGFIIEGQNGIQHSLPNLIECSEIPDNRDEIPTPDIARKFAHLNQLEDKIPKLSHDVRILLLLGRDIPEVHLVHEQIAGPCGPYAQRLSLGWVIVGETCLGSVHIPDVNVKKTYIRTDGRVSIFPACTNEFKIDDSDIFLQTPDDNKPGMSIEDRQFLDVMDREMKKTEEGNWIAPLPFKKPDPKLPSNRQLALKRAHILDSGLRKDQKKRKHFVDFMQKVIESGAAEVAPDDQAGNWYLPLFGVYHPKKPDKIRGVFDSSAMFQGVSLNSTLLSGPNLTNSLVDILLRFRRDAFAVCADIEQMFYSFHVKAEHRSYLRFFWYRDNDTTQDLIEYQMRAHVFGNSPSPAVATYGLRRTVEQADEDVREFVNENFYVDDGLTSRPTAQESIKLIKSTQESLKTANLRLHKIASNDKTVMTHFPTEDLQSNLMSLNFETDYLPINQTLGMSWDLEKDSFKFVLDFSEKPASRRGLLSTLNSIFDPMGLLAPVIVKGKMIMREIEQGVGWDDRLDPVIIKKWDVWLSSLQIFKDFSIPRMFLPTSFTDVEARDLLVFCDASEKAVSSVAYVRDSNQSSIGFVMGKSKLAPIHGHTIPRLELCAALLGAEMADNINHALDNPFQTIKFYSDSKVVLGYLHNTTKRFYNYVSNRVHRILSLTEATQWYYIDGKSNPADIGSRGCSTLQQLEKWIEGPKQIPTRESLYPLLLPDSEVRKEVVVLKVSVEKDLNSRFTRFSSWRRLIVALVVIKRAIRNFKTRKTSETKSESLIGSSDGIKEDTKLLILKTDQSVSFGEELKILKSGLCVPKNSPLKSLSPFIDKNGILRVGGRVSTAGFPPQFSQPVILSGRSHVARLIATSYHEHECQHQGRLYTESMIRLNGFWIIGAKRLISGIIYRCVTCRKLRGRTEVQKMADLPEDRVTQSDPFTSVGVDVFGPWQIISRKTRGGVAESKRWAVLFTCLYTRAVHIELLEDMSSSSFINALRRMIALRGSVKLIRSDRGTNFVGAAQELKLNVINVEDRPMSSFLKNSDIVWCFNAPHSSHMGGVWERMIGLARRILDNMLTGISSKSFTHEVLATLMAEVAAVINSRPIASISSDPDDVLITPAMLINPRYRSGISDIPVCLDIDPREMYRKQWKLVQILSDTFWRRWKEGYLQTLQSRRKWENSTRNIKKGDVVLLKDKTVNRGEWPMGVVVNPIESASDGLVRKAEVRISRNGECSTYTRPITEMVVLVE